MTRKEFLSLSTLIIGSAYPISCSKIPNEVVSCGPGDLTLDIPTAAPKTSTTKYLLKPITKYTSPGSLTLDCKTNIRVDLGGGKMSNAWTYNGVFPAPTLEYRNTDPVNITVTNGLSEITTTHWHGLIVNDVNDGGPMNPIAVGGSKTYNFGFNPLQRAGLNWYHPHPHMNTGKQVNLGMAGMFIIRDTIEDGLGLPTGEYEIPLLIRDATLDTSGNIVYKPTNTGFTGQIPLVNGTMNPYVEVKRAIYRLRILNGANTRIFGLNVSGLSGGKNSMRLIGNDGGLIPTSSDQTLLDIAPAERLDVLIDFRGLADGSKAYLKDSRGGWDLLEFRVKGTTDIACTYPSTNQCTINPFVVSASTTTRTFSFDGMTMINGKVFDMNRIDWYVPKDTIEKWVFNTGGNAPHPVHIHGASFQVIKRTGGRAKLFPWEQGWKDTVLLEDGETVEILIKFNVPGQYLLHCHKLEHEDQGMMANFVVNP